MHFNDFEQVLNYVIKNFESTRLYADIAWRFMLSAKKILKSKWKMHLWLDYNFEKDNVPRTRTLSFTPNASRFHNTTVCVSVDILWGCNFSFYFQSYQAGFLITASDFWRLLMNAGTNRKNSNQFQDARTQNRSRLLMGFSVKSSSLQR